MCFDNRIVINYLFLIENGIIKTNKQFKYMKDNSKEVKGVAIFQAKSGALELKVDKENNTIWLMQTQVANLFDVQKAAISKHVKNIFKSAELDKKATVSKMETVQDEGRRAIKRTVEYYNLDLILSIGYRVNSLQATKFRQWSTKILKQYLVDGYAINKKKIANNYDSFLKAVDSVKGLLPAESEMDSKSVLELVKLFSDTWLSLDAYDKDEMVKIGKTKKSISLTAEKLNSALLDFKVELIKKGEATDLFGLERKKDSIAGIVGNIMQTFGGQALYPSIEEKAAHLLYFIVKDHPFTDGNKRSGAYSFIWFLKMARILDLSKITPPALTALTLLVAESEPKNKEQMIRLILQLLKK